MSLNSVRLIGVFIEERTTIFTQINYFEQTPVPPIWSLKWVCTCPVILSCVLVLARPGKVVYVAFCISRMAVVT